MRFVRLPKSCLSWVPVSYSRKDRSNDGLGEGPDQVRQPGHLGSRSCSTRLGLWTCLQYLCSLCCEIFICKDRWLVYGISLVPSSLPWLLRLWFQIAHLFLTHLITRTTSGERETGEADILCSLNRKTWDTIKLVASKRTHLWSKERTLEKSDSVSRKFVCKLNRIYFLIFSHSMPRSPV